MSAKPINLALQGGGAHGAFTWGVLDALLESGAVEIVGVSATSAGALNAAALKAGLAAGGASAARDNLDWLWGQVGALDDMRLAHWMTAFSPAPGLVSKTLEYSLPFSIADAMSRLFSPYAYGPFYQNPLERIVEHFDFANIRTGAGPALFICATNVRSGKIRVFRDEEIVPEAILASACLPTMFQAVEIPDKATGRVEAYWDGGYTGNPALFPLFDADLPADIVIVNINPLTRPDLPTTAPEILNRINEISFNTSLLRELRAISFVQDLMASGRIPEGAMKFSLVHMIADDDLMRDLSVATKLVPTPSVLAGLKASGRQAAKSFLDNHLEDIGERSSVDLPTMFG
ncbi:patatin-like phospholipase family protein [Mesobaculum littorinae]|uniref:Patatin-like phospholipase family protein n=1 Tax=Mesobaculum littorinae TaxID=2486419 RepID=A0A438AM08_9RHOB|nr:patatin-like phospholipase family protein [Mesobaculum littorinae]RVV99635.1 patatin-like phospholipase family protein [Mesobaculum littorinae]